MIYKGRIDVTKLPTVDMQKKTSIALLAASPPQRSRSDSRPTSVHQQNHHGLFVNNIQEPNGISPTIPNIEPALPREGTFT